MLDRSQKEAVVKDIRESIDSAGAVFLTNLIGVTSNEAVKIRKDVRDAKGKIVITRNTLFKRAAQGTYLEELFGTLKGPNAVAFAFDDAPAVAKAIYEASKEQELITLNAGFLNQKFLSKNDVVALAKLPGRDQMLATLLATFNAPVSAFVRVLDAVKRQKEEGVTAEATV